jgi:hypothetical protein
MARGVVRLMTITAVVLFAGCGGSSNKSARTLSVGGGSREVIAKEGEFRTVIPPAYALYPSAAQYWVRGPEEQGFVTSLIVVREPVRKTADITTLARRVRTVITHVARRVSHLEPLSVDGIPAFGVDYLVTGGGTAKGKVTHVRQVLAKHGRWLYFIRDITLPTQYATSLEALDEVIRAWHWR